MGGRRLAFWGAVAGMVLIVPFAFNVIVDNVPSRGLKRFRDYITQSNQGS